MEIVEGPAVVEKPARHYAGIRVVTPFKGMFAVRDQLMKQLYASGLDKGLTFFRLHVIDMDGDMDVEAGVVTDEAPHEDGRIRAGVLPAGRYAAMTYVNHGMRANRTLLDWIRDSGLAMDRVAVPAGDRFGCRYEAYLTDPRVERMKTRWQIELAIRLT